jgi:hypothetical protein
MKKIYFILSATLLCASCGPTTVIQSDSYQPAPPAQVEEVSYQSFYDQLSPYGNWINYPGYGYVWSPNAGPDFQPYATNGNWIYTNAGWTWASNYNWGWAPFHYGRWFYENGYGWMWVPGSEWAPAWVSWRGGGDYYGWAPLGPSVSMNVALSSYNPPANYWNFVPRQYMGNPNWQNYYVPGGRNVTIINNTTIINNYSGTDRTHYAYAPGPDPNEVRRYSGNNFSPVQLRQSSTPGARISGSQYQIYQPRVSATPTSRENTSIRPANPAPARYESFNNMRPSNQNPEGQAGNNPRTTTSNPEYNRPANNSRSATSYPENNQPVNTQPVNNPRPATTNPGNNQPVYNQPANNPRPATVNPANNQSADNRPANNTRSSSPNASYNQPVNNPPVNNPSAPTPHAGDPRLSNPGDRRSNQNNQNSGNARPVPNNPSAQHSQANPVQTTTRPAVNHSPNNGHPVPKPAPAAKPETKPVAPPKTREANND